VVVNDRHDRDLARFREALERQFGQDLVTLAVFGSRAQGTSKPESDLDLLVVIRGLPHSRMKRRRLILPLAASVSAEFADTAIPVLLTPQEAAVVKPFYLGFLDGHRLLLDRDGFFEGVLERLRRRLEELGAKRLTDKDGYSYWDLKPDYRLGEDVVL